MQALYIFSNILHNFHIQSKFKKSCSYWASFSFVVFVRGVGFCFVLLHQIGHFKKSWVKTPNCSLKLIVFKGICECFAFPGHLFLAVRQPPNESDYLRQCLLLED